MSIPTLSEASKRKPHEVTQLKVDQEPFSFGDILQYESLKTLIIKDTEVEAIAEDIFYLPNLKCLSIIDNSKLENLSIPENCASEVFSLNLAANSLRSIPQNINRLSSLSRINLEQNKISKWGEGIFDLELEYLNLRANRLVDVPDSIRNLTPLRSLVLSHNKIRSINLCFQHDAYLEYLFLSNNKVEDFSISARAFRLIDLYLDFNNFRSVPESIGEVTSLERFSLSDNPDLKTIPDWLFKAFTNLRELNVRGTGLQELSESIGKLAKLEKLVVSNNELKTIPDSLYQLKKLASLDVSENELTELSGDISKMTSLRRLDVSFNHLKDFPQDRQREYGIH